MKASLVVLAALAVAAVAQPYDNCYYQVTEESYIDLNPLANQNWGPLAITTSSGWYLYFKPCASLTYTSPPSNYLPESNAFCSDDDLACQLSGATSSAAIPANLVGSSINTTSYINGVFSVHYIGGTYCPGNGNYRQMTINFSCGTAIGAPLFTREEKCHYIVAWVTNAACPIAGDAPGGGGSGGSSGGLSGGDVFLIIFFVGGFLYVAAGYAYMYKMKEARGIEAVPNIEFWRSLPGLCKDGAVFTLEKIKGLFSRGN